MAIDNFSPRQSMVALTLSSTLPAWRISSNKPLIWAILHQLMLLCPQDQIYYFQRATH